MKKIKFVLAVLILITGAFISCEKDKDQEEIPGQIPGMGNAGGELQAESYDFHKDLTFGEIKGLGSNSAQSNLKTDYLEITGNAQGSGDQVQVELTIINNHTTECRSVWFRAGTVFEVNLAGYQNGILLVPVNICVPPESTKTITLYLYCLNLGMQVSDGSASYEILGVTTSQAVLELIGWLEFKKVNYEHYIYFPGGVFNYNEVKDRLQEILWKITNGSGMDASDQEFINNLPDLPDGVFPESIYDLTIPLPDCWCIDECEVVNNSGALSYVSFEIDCGGPLNPIPDGDSYVTAGITFEVITEVPGGGNNGYIKFEDVEDNVQLGEDGQIETGVFTFWAPCEDQQITVTTKNKDEVIVVFVMPEVGQAAVMANGFMVEFISIEGNKDDGYTYEFNVVSDSCTGSNKK